MSTITYLSALTLLLVSAVSCDNVTDTCLLPWEAALEDWATSDSAVHNTRHGRIMSLPPSQGYYVSERIDLVPPPPPRPQHMHHRGPYPAAPTHHHGPPGSHHPPGPPPGSQHPPGPGPHYSQGPPGSYYPPGPNGSHHPPGSHGQHYPPGPPPSSSRPEGPHSSPSSPAPSTPQYDEWQATPPPPPGAGKIVNRPTNPYKDQFKPSYAPPSPAAPPIPVDRVDEAPPPPPHKQVSETDVYLLRAIEKLVYRVDLMEKRLRKMEENMHYIVAGVEAKPEPCMSNFTRIGSGCYHISSESANWKGASYACRRLKANLLELDDDDEKNSFIRGILADRNIKGSDLWTGGLNPGLLWIWSHSAKPVANNATSTTSIQGEGRCLALVSAGNEYNYQGQDCALKHRYVCEKREDKEKLGNEIERVARKLREGKRKPKIMWNDDDN